MKKMITRVLTLALACIMALSLAACGDSKDPSSTTESSASSKVATQSSSAEDNSSSKSYTEEDSKASTPSSGKYASIDEYVESDMIQSQIESLMESLEDNGIKMEIKGEDNRLIYEYTYTTDVGDVETVVSALEQSLDSNTSTFENVASSLKLAVDIEEPIVVVRYLDKDGKELCSREFSAN